MEKAYLLSTLETHEIIDEVFSSPEMALEYVRLQDGEDYTLHKGSPASMILIMENGHERAAYYIDEKLVDAKPSVYFGPQSTNGDIPVYFESQQVQMIEVRKGS